LAIRSQRHLDVILFGSHVPFINFGISIQIAIGDEAMIVDGQRKCLARLEGQDGKKTEAERTTAHQALKTATKTRLQPANRRERQKKVSNDPSKK
jgi:hypothetical protein